MSAGTVQQLAKTPMFRDLSEDEVTRIVDVGRVEYWQEGKLVLEEGSSGPRMMVLLEGTVEILRRDPTGVQRQIAELGPGEILGEMSLLLDMSRTATVRAKTALRVFAMDRAAFQDLIDAGDPAAFKFSLQLSRVMATRVIRLNDKVVKLLMATEGGEPLREQFAKARQEVFNLWDYED
jgi:CRP-like cAMP-binding protein